MGSFTSDAYYYHQPMLPLFCFVFFVSHRLPEGSDGLAYGGVEVCFE